jgi:hypothetical protein
MLAIVLLHLLQLQHAIAKNWLHSNMPDSKESNI